MENLWSVRMRASKEVRSQKSEVRNRNSKRAEIHISGAEGLYETSGIQGAVKGYIERALEHSRGKADKIIITIEDIRQKPKEISTLSVATVDSSTPAEGKDIAIKLLQSSGISKKAIDVSFELIKKGNMRGAAVITADKGSRLEPDLERGVRASRLGIDRSALKALSLKLARLGINTNTVKEALILASKVASCRHVLAELCVSDDPDYTTGYVASKKFGYLRISNIKYRGSGRGGRAFFVSESTSTGKKNMNVERIIDYLERMPVIIVRVASCGGIISIDEILNRSYK